jgi:hypothetical protein
LKNIGVGDKEKKKKSILGEEVPQNIAWGMLNAGFEKKCFQYFDPGKWLQGSL